MNNQDDKIRLAATLHRSGQLHEAKALYDELIQTGTATATLWHELGLIHAELGDWHHAEQAMRQGLLLDVGDETLQLHLANILKQQRRLDEAKAILENMVNKNPNNAAAWHNLGALYYTLSEWPKARSAFEMAMQLKADYIDAYYHLALTQLRQTDLKAAELTLQAILELDPSHPGAAFQLGSLYLLREQYSAAISPFEQLLKQHPYHLESHMNLAHAYLRLGRLSNAAMHYAQVLAIEPDDEQALFNLGVINMQQGNLTAAADYYRRILQQSPRSFPAHNNLGVVLLALKQREAALTHLQAALSIEPNNAALKHTLQLHTQPTVINETPNEYVRALFDGYADHYDAHLLQDLHYAVPKQFEHLLKTHTPLGKAPWEILDIGCGTGLCAAWLQSVREKGGRIVGVDIAPNMIKEAEKKGWYDALQVADINDYLQTCQQSFDVVLAGDVLVYQGDLSLLLKRVAQVLKPGGWFIFNIELGDRLPYVLAESGRFRHDPTYIREALPASLELKVTEVVTLRQQEQQAVAGQIFLVQRRLAL